MKEIAVNKLWREAAMAEASAIDRRFSVSPQLLETDFAFAAQQGFKSIINLRPDGEAGVYPTARQAEEMARANGLEYGYVPVKRSGVEPQQVAAFRRFFRELATPILAYCSTGRRAALMWALAWVGKGDVDDVLAGCAKAGHDLETIRPLLESIAAET